MQDLLSKVGVYIITCVPTGDTYIGSTTVSFKQRFADHKGLLRRGKHHNWKVQKEWITWGSDAFTFEPIVVTRKEDAIFYEQKCLNALKPSLNLAPKAGSCLGVKFSYQSRMLCRIKSGTAKHYDVGNGERLLISEICERTGLPRPTIKNRIKKGITGEALLKPKMTRYEIAAITHTKTYLVHGEELRVPAIAEKYGIPIKTVEMRIKMGWASNNLGDPLVAPMERQVKRYEIESEYLTLREISDKYDVPLKTLRARRSQGKRGLDLVGPVQQRTYAPKPPICLKNKYTTNSTCGIHSY